MNNRHFYGVFLVFLLLLVFTANAKEYTTYIKENSIHDFQLVTKNDGWILTNNHLYFTGDNGKAWSDITPDLENAAIRAVEFISPHEGWAILTTHGEEGISYALAKTIDGGISWNKKRLSLFTSDSVGAFSSSVYLNFIDTQTGWLVIRQVSGSNFNIGTLFKTEDGGATWIELNIPIAEPVYFITENIGWVAGGVIGNELYRTEDGGQSWYSQIETQYVNEMDTKWFYHLPKFEDENNGVLPVVTIEGTQSRIELYKTADAGHSWQYEGKIALPEEIDFAVDLPMALFDSQHWVLGLPDLEEDHLPPGGSITKISLPLPTIGWATYYVGGKKDETTYVSETHLIHTIDGGNTWGIVNLPQINSVVVSSRIAKGGYQPRKVIDQIVSGHNEKVQVVQGHGFDKAKIPTLDQLQKWMESSPYGAVNLYIGGAASYDPNEALSKSYLSTMRNQGWKFIPTWVGPQAPCSKYSAKLNSNVDQAYNEGRTEADKAIERAKELGLIRGEGSQTIIYYDMEAYNTTNLSCRKAVKSFINGWTKRIHEKGHKAGIYGSSIGSKIPDFADIEHFPDAAWIANPLWNKGVGYYLETASVYGINQVDDRLWDNHRRIRQYTLDIKEAYGGITLHIDSDVIDGPIDDYYQAPSLIHPVKGHVFDYSADRLRVDFDFEWSNNNDASVIKEISFTLKDETTGAYIGKCNKLAIGFVDSFNINDCQSQTRIEAHSYKWAVFIDFKDGQSQKGFTGKFSINEISDQLKLSDKEKADNLFNAMEKKWGITPQPPGTQEMIGPKGTLYYRGYLTKGNAIVLFAVYDGGFYFYSKKKWSPKMELDAANQAFCDGECW